MYRHYKLVSGPHREWTGRGSCRGYFREEVPLHCESRARISFACAQLLPPPPPPPPLPWWSAIWLSDARARARMRCNQCMQPKAADFRQHVHEEATGNTNLEALRGAGFQVRLFCSVLFIAIHPPVVSLRTETREEKHTRGGSLNQPTPASAPARLAVCACTCAHVCCAFFDLNSS
jgi:hypothetical protein